MALLLWVVAAVGVYAAGIAIWSRMREERIADVRRVTEKLARSDIQMSFDPATSTFEGVALGRQARMRWIYNGDAKGGGQWSTEVEIHVPLGPLLLNARPRTWLDRGDAAAPGNLQLREDAFTSSYLAEGAPSDVASAVLDADVRVWLLRHAPATLEVGGNGLRLIHPGKVEEAGEISSLLRGLSRVCDRIAAALDAPPGPPVGVAQTGGYRASATADWIAARAERHEAEREALLSRWSSVGRRENLVVAVIVIVVIGGLTLMLARCHGS